MTGNTLVQKLMVWRYQTMPQKYLVLLLSIAVGLSSGFAAALLKWLVHIIESVLTSSFTINYVNILYFIYPSIGLLLSVWLVKKLFFGKDVGHGIPNVLYAISKRNGIIPRLSMFNSMITSAITVGFGGSCGLEGPVVGTSAAIASNMGRAFRVNYKTKTLLIGCAASAAMASMFNAPIAAIVFAIEVIMLDLTTASMIPLLLASVSAALTSRMIFQNDILFHTDVVDGFAFSDVVFYALLGILGGIVSLYFSNLYFMTTKLVSRVKTPYKKAIFGGVMLGFLMFMLPALYGEGYGIINAMISGEYEKALINSPLFEYRNNIAVVLVVLVAIIFLKAIAMTITINAGGVGGIFAPTLFMGSILGFAFSKAVNTYELASLSETNFTLVGMGGLMAGILYAPLTAIFLIAEITGGYDLFIPLMVTTSLSYLTVRIFSKHSIYTDQLAKRGELITHDKDKAVLTLMKLQKEIETEFLTLHPSSTLRTLVKTIASSNRNLYPVLDDDGNFVGVVQLNDVREIMFKQGEYDTVLVSDLMNAAPALVQTTDNMDIVMKKFEETGAWNLPVVEGKKYVGYVSKSKLFSAYRKQLQDFYEE